MGAPGHIGVPGEARKWHLDAGRSEAVSRAAAGRAVVRAEARRWVPWPASSAAGRAAEPRSWGAPVRCGPAGLVNANPGPLEPGDWSQGLILGGPP